MNEIDIDAEFKKLRKRKATLQRLLKARLEVSKLERAYLNGSPFKATIEEIACVVCEKYGLTIERILSKSREADICIPRQLVFWIARANNIPFIQIGKAFHKDHGTVIYAVKSINNRTATDKKFEATANELKRRCQVRLSEKVNGSVAEEDFKETPHGNTKTH